MVLDFHISSVVLVTDKKAKVVQQFAYMPFGELLVDNSTVDLDYRFSAKETDRESGLGYFGARYYDNTSAMWLGVDPLWEKYAGMNPYNYCHGNPINMVNPDGNNDYELNEEGKLFFKKYTDSDKDVIYKYSRKPFSGKIKEKYTKSFTIDKGFLDEKNNDGNAFNEGDEVNKIEFKVGHQMFKGTELSFNVDKSKAKEFFEFAASESNVEWSYAEFEDMILVSTSHETYTEKLGAIKAQVWADKLKLHIHSHPNVSLDNGSPRNISQSDINFNKALKRRGYTGILKAYAVKYNEYIEYQNLSQPLLNQR